MITTDKILKKETTDWKIQLFRYVIVGGISFIVDYSLLFVLTEHVGLHYIVSATISFIAGLIVNYTISTSWIFRNSKLSNTTVEFIIYGAIGVVGLFLNNILLYLFTDILHIHYMLSKLITAALVMGWNFVGRRIILFNN
jgi:putative flippase GtrA